ncbi:unnamed protein product [Diplocarpon coronariae]
MSGATNPSPKCLSHSSKTYPIGAGPEVSGPMPRLAPVRATRPRLSSTSTPWTPRNSAPSLLLSPSMFRGREQRLGRRLASDSSTRITDDPGAWDGCPRGLPRPGSPHEESRVRIHLSTLARPWSRTRRAGRGFFSRLCPDRPEQTFAGSSLHEEKKMCMDSRSGRSASGRGGPGEMPARSSHSTVSSGLGSCGCAGGSQEPGTHGETRVCSGLSGGEEEGEGLLEKRRAGPPKARAGLRGREGCDARWRWNRSGTPYRVMCSSRPPHGECTGGWESAGWLVTRHAVLRGNRHTGRTGMSRRRPDQAIPLLYGASAHQIARSLGTDLPPKTCVQLCQGGGGRPASARLAAPRITRPDVFCPSPDSG